MICLGDLTIFLEQYGYIVLFVALLLELIAFPLPGEVLMSYTGFLVFQGKLNWLFSILVAGTGTCIGITISFWIGKKLGKPFFDKYGPRFHMGPKKFEKFSGWFSKYGNKLLFVAYFIPGVRHVTGYFSGIARLPYHKFCLFAYFGAFLWVSVFITLGKILGPKWETFHQSVSKYLWIAGIIVAVLLIAFFVYKKYKFKIKGTLINLLRQNLVIFHTRKRVGLFMIITSIVTLGFVMMMIGMIDSFIENEFTDFNDTVNVLISSIFNIQWTKAMQLFAALGSRQFQFILLCFSVIWILSKGKNKVIELCSFAAVTFGGEVFEQIVRKIFLSVTEAPNAITNQLSHHFPSEHSLMNFIVYGFSVFICLRLIKINWVQTFVPIVGLVMLILISISRLFFHLELPSDIVAGYVFGGVWLGLNILLLELMRLLKRIDIRTKPVK